MFFGGFLLLLCAMQLPGLPILRAVKGIPGLLLRCVPLLGFVAWMAIFFSQPTSVRLFGILGIPLAEWMIAYFVPFVLYLTLHPVLVKVTPEGAPASSALGKGTRHRPIEVRTVATTTTTPCC